MGQITTQEELRKAIALLEQRKQLQQVEIKQEFTVVKRELKPQNLLKNTFSRLAEIPEVKRTMVNTIVGFGLGYISKKASAIMTEVSLDDIVGNLVNTQVSKMENKDSDSFISKAISYFRKNIKSESPLYPFLGYKSDY